MIEIRTATSGIQVAAISIPVIGAALVRAVTHEAYLAMRTRAPVKRGDLRRSIAERSAGLEGEVTVGASYGVFVASGTRPHLIRPVRARALRFVVDGEVVFSTLVHHPGTKPNPFVQRAADCVQAMMPEIFDAVWKGEVG